jgi:hypothetical protein
MRFVSQHLSGGLLGIIENRAPQLTRETVEKLRSNPRTSSFAKLGDRELDDRVREVYENLRHWLWDDSEVAIQRWYNELGEKRFDEGIPLKEILWALALTKQELIEVIDRAALADSAMELYRKLECDRLIDQFFDRATYYAAEGYERRQQLRETVPPETPVRPRKWRDPL